MASDALPALLKLRLQAVDEARTRLVDCLRREGEAVIAADRARRAIEAEMNRANSLSAEDGDVEAFVTWLPRGRALLDQANAAIDRAQGETMRARAELNMARGAAEAVEEVIHQRAVLALAEVRRREQAEFDDRAGRAAGRRVATIPGA